MVKFTNGELEIIRKVDKEQLKLGYKLVMLALVLNLITFFFFWKLALVVEIFGLICFAVASYLYKKDWKETKTVSFTKEYLKIYRKNDVKTFETKDIENFVFDPNSSLNVVFVNYKTKEGKKQTHSFLLVGLYNRQFVDIANNLLKNGFENTELEEVDDSTLNEKDEKAGKELIKKFYDGEPTKVLFVGKTKMLKQNGDMYYIKRDTNLIFSLADADFIFTNMKTIEYDYTKLKVGAVYLIEYKKINGKIKITESEGNDFDQEKINKSLQEEDLKWDLIKEDNQIIDELKAEETLEKVLNVFRVVLGVLLLAIMITLKLQKGISICVGAFFTTFVIFGICNFIIENIKKKELLKYYTK